MFNVVHFEIPADDVERARKFYSGLFGWKIEKFTGPTPMEYWEIATGAEKGEMGLSGGGMMQRQMPEERITMYVNVPSVDDYVAKVKKLGGRVVVPKMAVPEMGYFAVCLDPENNGFGIWEVNPQAM
ncbi:MAG: VOC family protein [Deltaproteobacteria bacterium]|nr:VOC family protein [Deltaproteobacteria bacterium]